MPPSACAPLPQPASPGLPLRPSLAWLGAWLAVIPFAIWLWGDPRPLTPFTSLKWPLMSLATAGFVILTLWESAKSKEAQAAIHFSWRSPLTAGAVCILAGLALSGVCSPVKGLSLREGIKIAVPALLAWSLSLRRVNDREMRWMLGALLGSMTLQAALTLLQRALPSLGAGVLFNGLPNRSSMIGTFSNAEHVASWLCAGVAASAVLLIRARANKESLKTKLLYAAALLLTTASIVISASRGAFLAAAVACTVWSLANTNWRQHRSKIWIAVGLSAILTIVLAGAMVFMSAAKIHSQPDQHVTSLPARLAQLVNPHSTSVRHRIGLATVNARIILTHPLTGVGAGRFGAVWAQTQRQMAQHSVGAWALGEQLKGRRVTYAHCDPMQWWAEFGLLPLAGLMLMSLTALYRGWQASTRGGITEVGALSMALLALWLNMWVSFPLQLPVRAMTFWVLVGLLASLGPASHDTPANECKMAI